MICCGDHLREHLASCEYPAFFSEIRSVYFPKNCTCNSENKSQSHLQSGVYLSGLQFWKLVAKTPLLAAVILQTCRKYLQKRCRSPKRAKNCNNTLERAKKMTFFGPPGGLRVSSGIVVSTHGPGRWAED